MLESDTLTRAIEAALKALTIPGPAGQHATAAHEHLWQAGAATDPLTRTAHLKAARQEVDAALKVLGHSEA